MPEECAKLAPLTPVIREGLASRQWLDMSTINKYMIYKYIWVNYNDLTATSLEPWLVRGIIPKLLYFRLVNYYHLPRYMYIHIYGHPLFAMDARERRPISSLAHWM
jgi:hypothetical protein